MNDGQRFDPRHDPIFQRGYDAVGDGATDARESLRGAPQRAAESPMVPGGSVPGGEPGAASEGARPDPRFAVEARRNPYLIALGIAGLALVVGGVVMQVQAAQGAGTNPVYYGGPIPFAMMLQQIVFEFAPVMVEVGLATLLGLAFLQAVRWRTK